MKIAYLFNSRMPTEKAHGRQIAEMCSAFTSEGHDVTLVVPDRENHLKEDVFAYYGIAENFRVVKVPVFDAIRFSRWLGPLALWILEASFAKGARKILKEIAPDVIYSRDTYSNLWTSSVPLRVMELHTLPKRLKKYYASIWKMSDRLVAMTEGLREELIALGIPEDRLMVAHDAVNLERFSFGGSKSEAREALGVPHDRVVAIYIGRFYEEQGIETLVGATEKLSSDTLVVMVGGNHPRGDTPNRKLVGHVPPADIPKWLRVADFALMPYVGTSEHVSRYASPMKLFEYLGAGLSIVASDLPSVREVLTESEAVFVPPDNADALAGAIDALASDSKRIEEMGRASAEKAKGHTWRARASQVLSGLKRSEEARKGWVKWWPEISILALAFFVRLLYVLVFPQQPLEGGDALAYLAYADWMRGAIPWDNAWNPTFQVGYPAFLALIRALFGESLAVIRVAQALVGTATVGLVMLVSYKVASRKLALVAGLIVALYVPFVLSIGTILTEPLFQFMMMLSVWTILLALEDRRIGMILTAGIISGFAGSVREIGFYLSIFMLGYFLFRTRDIVRSLVYALMIFIIALTFSLYLRFIVPAEQRFETAPILAKGYEVTLLTDRSFKAYALDPARILMYPEGLVRYFALPYRLTDLSVGSSVKSALLSFNFARITKIWPEAFVKSVLLLLHWLIIIGAITAVIMRKFSKDFLWITSGLVLSTGVAIVLGSVGRPAGFTVFEPLARYRFPLDPLLIILAVGVALQSSAKAVLKSILAKLALILIGLTFSFVFLEWGLRTIGIQGDIRRTDPLTGLPILPQSASIKLWSPCFQSKINTNTLGFHDGNHTIEKPEGVTRVAVLGDSFIEGIQVPRGDLFSSKLETRLNEINPIDSYEVISFGISGSGTYSNLLYYRSYAARFHPDIVLLGFFENDLKNDHTSPPRPGLLPVFNDEDEFVDGETPTSLQNPLKSALRRSSLLLSAYRYFDRIRRDSTDTSIGFSGLFSREESQLWRRRWDHEEQLLRRLNNDVTRDGGKLIIMSIPAGWRVKTMGNSKVYDFLSPERHLATISESLGITFIPLIDKFPQITKDSAYLECDGHWSPVGHDTAARIVADIIGQ